MYHTGSIDSGYGQQKDMKKRGMRLRSALKVLHDV